MRLNPDLPQEALEDASRRLTRGDAPSLVECNRGAYRVVVDGVTNATVWARTSIGAEPTPTPVHARLLPRDVLDR